MEDNRTLSDVDYVCIQRVERFNLSGFRNQESCKNTASIPSLWYSDCDSPLSWYKYPLCLRYQSGGNERCYLSRGACNGQPFWKISRYTLLSPDSICSFFLPECFHYNRTKGILFHGQGRIVFQISSHDTSKISGPIQFNSSPAVSYTHLTLPTKRIV